jgi:hypothetical protein
MYLTSPDRPFKMPKVVIGEDRYANLDLEVLGCVVELKN